MRLRVAILASTLGLAAARAEPAAPTALSWHRLPGAEACPGLKEVALRVSAHLGRDPFATPSVASVFIEGAPLALPNGVAMDNDGNIVVVNIGTTAVLTFSPDGKLLKTENAVQPGNDGLVILRDGTKYVSSVRQGGVSRSPTEGTG